MPSITVRNVPDEVYRAIYVRAAQHGRSVEAEVRDILESAVKPQGRVKLDSWLAELGRKLEMAEDEFAIFEEVRGKTPARAVSFECCCLLQLVSTATLFCFSME